MNEFLSKQGQGIRSPSHLLLHYQPMDRPPTMQHIAQAQNLSVGTIQAAIQYLQSSGSTDIENRGRLGAFAQQLNYVG